MAQTDSTAESSDEPVTEPIGIGLDLFSKETPEETRYRFLFHFGVYAILLFIVIWPIFPAFNRIEPYVLGLPLNMFWNTLVLVLIFINGVFLYRFDEGKILGEAKRYGHDKYINYYYNTIGLSGVRVMDWIPES